MYSCIGPVPSKQVEFQTPDVIKSGGLNDNNSSVVSMQDLPILFHNSFSLGSIRVDRIQLEAGAPTALSD
jgi:hypothetical protein